MTSQLDALAKRVGDRMRVGRGSPALLLRRRERRKARRRGGESSPDGSPTGSRRIDRGATIANILAGSVMRGRCAGDGAGSGNIENFHGSY